MKEGSYDKSFYSHHMDRSYRSASLLLPVLFDYYRPKSVVDIGCGIGTWLKAFQDLGVGDFEGLDGDYVDRNLLLVEPNRIRQVDLALPFSHVRRFDLAVCLEVAEHIPSDRASGFVKDLTALSDVILFSAALPYQGGTGHVNENWLEYWGILFRRTNYVAVDILRTSLWANDRVSWWYRQNVLIFVRENLASSLFPTNSIATERPLSIIQPELFLIASVREPPSPQLLARSDRYYYREVVQAYCRGDTDLPAQPKLYGPEFHLSYSILTYYLSKLRRLVRKYIGDH
ncbi:MAG: methyltransferase domain-containing protein [Pseudomonadota bacterium]